MKIHSTCRLIEDIEQVLAEIDADEWQLSENLERYIIERCDELLCKWRDIKRSHSNMPARDQLVFFFDALLSEVYSERDELQGRVDFLDDIDDDLDGLIASA